MLTARARTEAKRRVMEARVTKRDDGGLNQDNVSGAGEKWSNSGYILSRFADRMEASVRQGSQGGNQVIEMRKTVGVSISGNKGVLVWT